MGEKFNIKLTSDEKREYVTSKVSVGNDTLEKSQNFENFMYSLDLDHLYQSHENKTKDIETIFKNFHDKWIKDIYEKLETPKKSVFSESGAYFFASASAMTRSLSTELGNVWEEIACLSDKVISPEKTFGNYKVAGVDIIIKENDDLIFTQIKTAKDTLTGSQEPRSKLELGAFKKSMFAAAHNIGGWHFKEYSKIPRVAGKEFWDLIEIDYSEILEGTSNLFAKLEPPMLKHFLDIIEKDE